MRVRKADPGGQKSKVGGQRNKNKVGDQKNKVGGVKKNKVRVSKKSKVEGQKNKVRLGFFKNRWSKKQGGWWVVEKQGCQKNRVGGSKKQGTRPKKV